MYELELKRISDIYKVNNAYIRGDFDISNIEGTEYKLVSVMEGFNSNYEDDYDPCKEELTTFIDHKGLVYLPVSELCEGHPFQSDYRRFLYNCISEPSYWRNTYIFTDDGPHLFSTMTDSPDYHAYQFFMSQKQELTYIEDIYYPTYGKKLVLYKVNPFCSDNSRFYVGYINSFGTCGIYELDMERNRFGELNEYPTDEKTARNLIWKNIKHPELKLIFNEMKVVCFED